MLRGNVELGVGGLAEVVYFVRGDYSALERVRVDYVRQAVHYHAPATLFCHVLVLVFCFHVLLGKVAVVVLEAFVVQCN